MAWSREAGAELGEVNAGEAVAVVDIEAGGVVLAVG